MDVTFRYYLVTRVVPATVASLIFPLVLNLILADVFSNFYVRGVIWCIPLFVFVSGVVYPLTIFQQRKYKIEVQMLLFITRVSVVTYSSIARKNVFDILKYADEFDELAIEVNKIYKLIDNWKISTPEACRLIARQTPSDMFADFLDRVAIAIENAENPSAFLSAEHELVLEEYASRYEMMLERFAVFREIYTALLSIALFPFVIFTFIPLLVDFGTYLLMLFSIALIIMMNVILIYGAHNILLKEKVWHQGELPTKDSKLVVVVSLAGMGVFVVLLALLILVFWGDIPILLIGSIAVIPLFVSGLFVILLEGKIIRREEVYAPFMSSLGHSTETKGLEATKALDKLRHHDFGDLTKNINDLYVRLKTRIDSELSWEYFGTETNSEMISKFSKFYVEGAKQGGNPKAITNVITKTFTRIKSLRKKRMWGSSFFVIMTYFVVFITSFVGYAAYHILKLLVELIADVNPTTEAVARFQRVAILNPDVNLEFVHGILIAIIIVNIIGAVVISRVTSGGHRSVAMLHIAIHTWISYAGYLGAYFLFYYYFG